ncbi:hypothetical protein CYMTET_27817 [Cymbomonas tetramitiformis]|uniref:Uncharacterized protein n=1 Tax=Cymbomonas tetramitiformis TaxID=36881 RepID=A0AAE0KWI4_9CHLO|nr:hypothetical protein CYMTET_27817 [Cymbomonas tetramitiformis]
MTDSKETNVGAVVGGVIGGVVFLVLCISGAVVYRKHITTMKEPKTSEEASNKSDVHSAPEDPPPIALAMIDTQVQDNSLAITAITSVSEDKQMAPEVIVEASEEEMTMVAAAIAPSQARVALMKFYQERGMHEQVDNVDVILSTYGLDQIGASCVEKYGADPFAPAIMSATIAI